MVVADSSRLKTQTNGGLKISTTKKKVFLYLPLLLNKAGRMIRKLIAGFGKGRELTRALVPRHF